MTKKITPVVDDGHTTGINVKSVDVPWTKVFLFVALISTVVGALLATKTLAQTEKKIAEAKEMARPADIALTKITTPDCTDCFNLEDAVAAFKKQNVNVGEEKALVFDSSEAQSLITELGIKRLPTYVVTGEVDKESLTGFTQNNGEIKNDTFVFTNVTPLYFDTESKKEIGRVTVTYLTDPSCASCLDPKLTIDAYKKAGIKISDEVEIPWNSAEGQRIISQYSVTKLPTFILSADFASYPTVKDNWSQIGSVESDGAYVARQLFLPYRDIEKGQIVGLVDVVYVTDSSCADCYKPAEVHKNILVQGFGVGIRSERTVDINSSEGKGLVSKYNLTQVPTLLMSPEVSDYANIKSVWPQVGTTETDGWYVFRQISRLGNVIYKDLTNNQIIRPQQQQAVPQQ